MTFRAARSDYWTDAAAPLTSVAFLLPWLLVYEFGIVWLSDGQSDTLRNGADAWLRLGLKTAGLADFLLPLLVVGLLVMWHAQQRRPWQLRLKTQAGMLGESILLAAALLVFGQLHQSLFISLNVASAAPQAVDLQIEPLCRAIVYLGAGVYEEVLFRLMLLPSLFLLARMLDVPRKPSAVLAGIVTAFVFAAAHHVGPAGEAFDAFRFTFRAVAGGFFAAVFLWRGFGITVGCHAVYDLLVGVLLYGT